MTEEARGIALDGLDEQMHSIDGTPRSTLSGGDQVSLTRKLAIVKALEEFSDADDKFKAFHLGMRFNSANGSISISAEESVMIKAAVKKAWAHPGVCVPLCEWLEGE